MKLTYFFLLPVVGLGVLLTTHWMTDWVLNRSYISTYQLQTNLYPKTRFVRSLAIISIDARVDRSNDITEVTLKTAPDASLKQLEFKFPLTEPSQLETALALELGTTVTSIRALMDYHFD